MIQQKALDEECHFTAHLKDLWDKGLAGHGALVSQLTKAFVTRDSGFRFQVPRFTEIFSACIHCRPAVHPPPSVRRQRLQKPNHEAENSPRANQRELVLLENGVQHALKLRR